MKILASDYDGTLRQSETVSQEEKEAIQKFREAGNLFGICTGRCLDMIVPELKAQGIEFDFAIGSNGSTIQLHDGTILLSENIPFHEANQILDYLLMKENLVHAGVSDGIKYCPLTEIDEKDEIYGYAKEFLVDVDVIKQGQEITSFFLMLTDETVTKEIKDDILMFAKEIDYYDNADFTDIIKKGVSKYSGVKHYADQYDDAEVYVIGDDYNDLPMIEGFGGFAVQNAKQEVINASSKVFQSVSECIHYLLTY